MDIGERIRFVRQFRGLTQTELAEKSGLSADENGAAVNIGVPLLRGRAQKNFWHNSPPLSVDILYNVFVQDCRFCSISLYAQLTELVQLHLSLKYDIGNTAQKSTQFLTKIACFLIFRCCWENGNPFR